MAVWQNKLDFLVNKGLVSKEQLEKAREESAKTGLTLSKSMEKLGFISELDIAQIVAESMGVPFMDLTDYLVDPEVIRLVPEELARKYKVVPLFKIADSLTVAMQDPHDVEAIDALRSRCKVSSIDPVFSTPDMVEKVISQYYSAQGNIQELADEISDEKLDLKAASDKGLAEAIEETPVIKLVNLIIFQAVKDRASDIHIEPEDAIVRIRYRIDGLLHETQQIPKHLQSVLASRIKVMAKMDIAETRNPQDGRIQLKIEGKGLDLRVSSFPTVHGENIVMRILDKSSLVLGLGELGFLAKELEVFDKVIRRPNGIILVTGPTGSGKTTTLYSALSTINSLSTNIITIEDPVEYELPLIRQTQVNPRAGLTFANGLRSILRQDPDIIMVGEIRDKETAEIAIQASLTGHLVFSTLHTNDSASALTRLIDMGVEPFLIASSVIAILAQRLVRMICPSCKEEYTPASEALKELHLGEKGKYYHGKGCSKCKDTGFAGRVGIYELLLLNDEIRNMVAAKVSAQDIKKKAVALGMRTLFDDGMQKVNSGMTTVEEVLRVTEES
jgi:type IV pilus assembly protein PilB